MSIITKTTIAIAALGLSMSTMDTICLSRSEATSVGCTGTLLGGDYSDEREGLLKRLWTRYCELAAKRRGRLALEEMSEWQLKDIGVSEKDARQESTVPFWR
ncbi:DUF1127 domain-containing protein [Ensifer sp. SL37]|jgi:uncharacterized protein YjiS (DUF1127 family)|uniref:DUF1127 domain-containing protein n=1 Tax=Ensifer sp. SL37 TaxID=2995137 RepID=UPI00227239A3|nr:DUF1127 domain-containing protein [Ensifer sp. SL37]MCY1744434.1 DUF1127 domain-containing protein [Ensifer sp. SL37]